MFHRIQSVGLSVIAVLLVACAQIPGPASTPIVGGQQTDTWQVAGRFAAGQSTAQGGAAEPAAEPVAGRFSWQHTAQQDQLWLIGPLGNILARIDIGANGVHWQDARGRHGEATDMRALADTLGLALPDVPASAWLRGQWPAHAAVARDNDAHVLTATDRDWQFQYRYGAPAPANWPLSIEGTGPDGWWLRVVLTQWDGADDPAAQPAP